MLLTGLLTSLLIVARWSNDSSLLPLVEAFSSIPPSLPPSSPSSRSSPYSSTTPTTTTSACLAPSSSSTALSAHKIINNNIRLLHPWSHRKLLFPRTRALKLLAAEADNNESSDSSSSSSSSNSEVVDSEGQTEEANALPLFVETKKDSSSTISTKSVIDEPPPEERVASAASSSSSLTKSIERVRNSHALSAAASNDDTLKRIVRAGIKFQQKKTYQAINAPPITTNSEEDDDGDNAKRKAAAAALSFPTMERVPGCIATVHLQTTLVPLASSDNNNNGSTDKNGADGYRVAIDGNADAMLSGGLLAILADTFGGGGGGGGGGSGATDDTTTLQNTVVSAADVLNLNPETVTAEMGLQSVLSRGRNDGMASMVRVIQRQIKSLMGEGESSSPDIKSDNEEDAGDHIISSESLDSDRLDQLLLQSTSFPAPSQNKDAAHKPTVAMLLSGGVDSSVALHLLLCRGYNVTAFYLRIWLEDELAHLGECPWEDDLRVCQAVCEHAGSDVRLETVSLGKEYREGVVQYTIEEARRGRTPNPDIMCNSRVKFGCFLEYIEETSGMEFDYVASGHYARLEDVVVDVGQDGGSEEGEPRKKRLFRAPDPVKDQSYFLCALTQQQLSKVIFPIGSYQKSEVRELATHFELPNRNRPDSQGLCFLGKVKFDEFLASYLGKRPGDVVDTLNGEVIGRHNGLWYHTVGQRKGIGKVMFPLATARGPWYVVAKDQKHDIVYVSNRYDEEDFAKARSEFEVEDVRWILGDPPVEVQAGEESDSSWKEVRVDMKIRHGPRIVQGSLLLKEDGSTGNIRLDKKDGGLAPGQYVVFYKLGTDECLGAGVISEKHWAKFLQNYEELLAGKAGEEIASTS